MLNLRTEKNDLSILANLHCVPWRPIEQIATRNGLFLTVRIGDRHLTLDQIAPVGRLAKVILQTL